MTAKARTKADYKGNIPIWKDISFKRREKIKRIAIYALLIPPIIVIVFPILWTIVSSFQPEHALYTRGLFPEQFSTGAYEKVLFDSEVPRYYLNSLVVAAGVVLLTTVTATLGGYGLTRLEIPFKRHFARGILMGYMFPAIMLSIPMYVLWRNIGGLNTYWGLILAETALALPFGLWLMWKFFQTVPYSHEEAAIMSGATRFEAFKDVALPSAKPGIIAVAIFAYAVSWNAFTMPLVLAPDRDMYVLTVGIQSLIDGYQILWSQVMAAVVLMIIPSLLFVYFLQEHILEGFRVR